MCGITGFWDTSKSMRKDDLTHAITGMSEQIIHRGPDDWGIWVDESNGIALGFRRLAILDLTPTGHQPMSSADERYTIVFNGEIYNFSSLRDELFALGHIFTGTSDTEIMLASISQWGLKSAVERFNGMFAFALWDKQDQSLSLVRDRMGIKPLYYGWLGKTLVFGSELKAIRAHPDFHAEIDRASLDLFLRYSYIPQPYSIYRNIHKLPQASIFTIHNDVNSENTKPEHYWSVKKAFEQGSSNPVVGSEIEIINALEQHLTNSISLRMIADVPLGAFLSGGIDSSTVVSLMQKISRNPVHTFTIGFHESGFDEAVYARAVANHLGTSHTELYIIPDEARAVIPRLPTLYDEPFADPSQIPTFLVSALARQTVTVSLSGDGGDELYGGYNRYLWVERIWKQIKHMPPFLRKTISGGIELLRPQDWAKIINFAGSKLPNPADKIQKISEAIKAQSPEAIYHDLVTHWKESTSQVIGAPETGRHLQKNSSWEDSQSLADCMMKLDQITYLPDDVLAKVDRASMGTSLEVRAPFLDDHETVEFAWRIPNSLKIRNGQGKWILRQILKKYIPNEMIERPKMGFGVPIDSWLRGPLQPWSENLLDNDRLQREGFLHPEVIQRKWHEHKSGSKNWQYDLWNVLMFQAWLEANRK